MNEFTIETLMLSIGALVMRRRPLLDALESGTSVEGEDNDHLAELVVDLEGALAEFREEYEQRRGDSGLYPTFDQLVDSHER